MHVKGHVREALTDSLMGEKKEWYRHYPSKAEALRVLGRLWNCTDSVGESVRSDFADWIFGHVARDAKPMKVSAEVLLAEELSDRVRQGCTYAVLVRILRPLVQELPERK